MGTCVHVCARAHASVCVHVEARDWHPVSSSIGLHLRVGVGIVTAAAAVVIIAAAAVVVIV